MLTKDDLVAAVKASLMGDKGPVWAADYGDFVQVDGDVYPTVVVEAVLDALASRVPSVCPSGFDWTAGDIEDWLRAVKDGRA